MRAILVCAIALGGCVFYAPASFREGRSPFVGKRAALGCIDLAVALSDDALARGPVVAYTFGNRCMHAVGVDLASVRAIGRYADGRTSELAPYDPKHELRALRLDAWWHGREAIEYVGADGASTICVDVGAIDRSAPVAPRWICLGASDGAAS